MISTLLKATTLLLAIYPKELFGYRSCSGERPLQLCSEFIVPFEYNSYQWYTDCGTNVVPGTLIADNVEVSLDSGGNIIPVTPCNATSDGYYKATCCASYQSCFSIGVDCEDMTAPPVPSSYAGGELPRFWWPYTTGCAVDTSPSSILINATVTYQPGLLPYFCVQSCAINPDGTTTDYTFAGLQDGDECWCGTGIVSNVQAAPQSECNLPCSGGYTFSCGAYQRMELFYYNPYLQWPPP